MTRRISFVFVCFSVMFVVAFARPLTVKAVLCNGAAGAGMGAGGECKTTCAPNETPEGTCPSGGQCCVVNPFTPCTATGAGGATVTGYCQATCQTGSTGAGACSGGTCCIPAENNTGAGSSYGYIDPLGGVSVPTLVARIISRVLPLVGALFLAMFVWGGFLWFSSAGEEKKVAKARQTLSNAVIGIGIVMGAYALVSYIIKAFGKSLGQ